MRNAVALGIAFTVGTLSLIGLDRVDAIAVPDGVVVIHSGALRPTMMTVIPCEQVTWINATGAPVVRLLFDPVPGAPESSGLFTSSATLVFPRPGLYPYTAFVGSRALSIRGKIVVR